MRATRQSQWISKDRLGEPGFPLASETAQLQAADLLVHLNYLRMLQCHQAGDWTIPPSETLNYCLWNTRSLEDHFFLNTENILEVLKIAAERSGIHRS